MTFATLGFGDLRRGLRILAVLAVLLGLVVVSAPAIAQAPDPAAEPAAPGEPAAPAEPEPAIAGEEPADPAVAGEEPADPAVAGEEPADPAVAGEEPAAPEEIGPDTVVATVNGIPITEADLAQMAQLIGEALFQYRQEEWRALLIDVAVDFKLAVAAARELELDQTPQFIANIEAVKEQALREEYVAGVIVPLVTEETVLAAYNDAVALMTLPQEVQIRHIMVETEAEANDILLRLNAGEDFETLARDLSLDLQTGADGGLLGGFWAQGELIQEFDDVVFLIEPGTVFQVPIPLGESWHVIKIDERRLRPPPPFDELREALTQGLINQAYTDAMAALREDAVVEIVPEVIEILADEAAPAEAPAAEAPAGEAPAAVGPVAPGPVLPAGD